MRQTYTNFTLFAVNDGSEDHTEQILRDYMARYPDTIRVLSQKNKGCGEALNKGFAAANAEYGSYDYGTMVSADNIYYPNFLSSLAIALDYEPSNIVMVYGDFNYINEANQITNTLIHAPKDATDLVNGYDQGIAFMFRMEAKNKAGPYWRRICEDYPMAVRLAQFGDFRLVSLVLAAFRVSQAQLTGSNVFEEERAAEYSRRMAQKLLLQQEVCLDDVYPEGVDPWQHRYDEDVAPAREGGVAGALDDV
jgi:glycosyltransferase involved in cell wall biosynthesis